MKKAGWITLVYGLLVLIGGIMGHIKAASTSSLITGTLFGFLLLMTGIGMLKEKLFSAYSALILIALLTIFFIYRYLYTFRVFPAGFMSIVSLVVLVLDLSLMRDYFRPFKGQHRK